jgi:prepilin-type processing-associated H-X9-DG protein
MRHGDGALLAFADGHVDLKLLEEMQERRCVKHRGRRGNLNMYDLKHLNK